MKNLVSAKDLRQRIAGSATSGIEKSPGVYRWWFVNKDATQSLLAKNSSCST